MKVGINIPESKLTGEEIPKGVELVHAPETWQYTRGAGVRIGLLSTGIYVPHEDLHVVERVSHSSSEPDPQDRNGSGTNCSGLIAAKQNGAGIVGVAPEASLISVKVLNSTGTASLDDFKRALEWCLSAKLDVVAIAFGGAGTCEATLQELLTSLASAGSIIVCPNAGTNNNPHFPGACNSVISAAAQPSEWSSEISDVRCWAGRMKTTEIGGGYSYQSGTLQSVALVAGAVALIKSVASNMLVDDVRNLLKATGDDVDPGYHPYRQLNVFSAVKQIIRP